MKIQLYLFVIFFALALYSCNSDLKITSNDKNTAFYQINLPDKQNDKSKDNTQIITLDVNKSIHKLDFGIFSTESTIEILKPDSSNDPIISQHLKPNEKQILDISKLNKGIYKIRFTAIAESCTFPMEIK